MDDLSPSSSSSSSSASSSWRPSQLLFTSYSTQPDVATSKSQPSRLIRRPFVARLTKDIVETYRICNPQFKYSEELNPKRYLTSPSIGVLNEGHDNVNSDLILTVNFVLVNLESQQRYIVKDVLGHGTFGQVAKCWVPETNSFVAVKIIKNQPAYYQQALVEVSILTTLNKKYDPEDKHHIVRIYDYFVYHRHLCISFELLDTNLYELIKINHFRGLSLTIVQLFSKQILHGLALLKDAGIIHCDLKPENILLCTSKPAEIKIIDFGSACMEDRTVYSYIQSRYYRSPEVLLGYQYTTAIDMWSFGCIVAELFLGLPLFPGASEFDLLRRMIEILGGQPPDFVLKEAKNTSKFFKCIRSVHSMENGEFSATGNSSFQALTEEEYEARELKRPTIGKEYFKHMNLEEIVTKYPYRKNLPKEDMVKESQIRLALVDFLRGLVEFDPSKRWSPFQASKHPFVTGEPFTCPYQPPSETPRMSVAQNIRVDHHPGGGHWFAAGLSPNIPGRNRVSMHSSPHFQVVPPYAHANSYGSVGSHGSYNDGTGLGSSYGSYGDTGNMFAYYSPVGPSGMNMHAQGNASMLGNSPDARRRIIPYSHGNGLGMSPSAGSFAPLPLGTSPSQFTPPSSYGQVSAGSPGHYGPTSPARGSCHGSPLGKMAAVSQFNRRKSWGYPGGSQTQESSSSHWQGQPTDSISSGKAEGNSQVIGGSPSHLPLSSSAGSWKQQRGGSGSSAGYLATPNMPGSFKVGSNIPKTTGVAHENPEARLSLPDPGDWDPNYSDELLLQEDGSDTSCLTTEFSNGMHLNSAETLGGVGQFSSLSSTSSGVSLHRQSGPIQSFSHAEVGIRATGEPLAGYVRLSNPSHFMPHISQNSPSRLGQQSQRFNHGRPSNSWGNDWNHMKVQPPPPNINSGGPHSPGNSSFSNGTSWGRRASHPVISVPPASRGLPHLPLILTLQENMQNEYSDQGLVCPSFDTYSSPSTADTAAKVCREFRGLGLVDEDNEYEYDRAVEEQEEDDDFEFVSFQKSADEVFFGDNTRIGPVFPVFNRDLISQRDPNDAASSSASSDVDELEGVPAGSYCVWMPKTTPASSPSHCKKSKSTGTSSSRKWRLRDLLRRSNSEGGKDSFVLLTPALTSPPSSKKLTGNDHHHHPNEKMVMTKGKKSFDGRPRPNAVSMAHEVFYAKSKEKEGYNKRQSYLPYRKELVGFFASVNAMGRTFPTF